MTRLKRGERRQMILETLARMLEENQGEHITTAALARAVGVSEAALYRHFPGKAQMFEALIEFIEESIFTRANRISEEERALEPRLRQTLALVLGFAERNPGMSRLLFGDVLTGETVRLRERIAQFYDRLETQLRQMLRDGSLTVSMRGTPSEGAALLMAVIEGRIARFVRSGFRVPPLAGWDAQWNVLRDALLPLQ
jgi:TetR/AcrR family transcriptional regulator